uniref:C-type lectin domain-containing protein n=1 Tax=Astyanax mexicanus TaxID=7994 RepID=A0A3B1ILA1_ASTMX
MRFFDFTKLKTSKISLRGSMKYLSISSIVKRKMDDHKPSNQTELLEFLYCRENHVDLVSVHTEGIQRWVETVARNASTDNVWVGLWIWSDGSNSSYRDWSDREPNNGVGDNCVQLQSEYGYRWNDVGCLWTGPLICYEGE